MIRRLTSPSVLLLLILTSTGAVAQIPMFHSRPTAAKKIFLDFRGDEDLTSWNAEWEGGPVITFTHEPPPLGVPAPNLTSTQIEEIYDLVADRFWIFNIDVTTDAAALNASEYIRVVFDDVSTDWQHPSESLPTTGGAASYGADFHITATDTNSYWEAGQPTTDPIVFVFTESGFSTWPLVHRYAMTACHEVGHMLGYIFDVASAQTVHAISLGPGGGLKPRWGWSGPAVPLTELNGDTIPERNIKSFIANIGGRPEGDEGGITAPINLAVLPWNYVFHDGAIDTYRDEDWFAFEVETNTAKSLEVQVRPWALLPHLYPTGLDGPWAHALDVKLTLYDKFLNVVASADPLGEDAAGFWPTITFTPPQGSSPETYWLKVEAVASDGIENHGELGRYLLEAWHN